MINHIEVPNYVFFSNFTEYGMKVRNETGPLTPELCIRKTMERFPNVPKEAILVTPHFEIPTEFSVYLSVEFKPEIDAFMRELQDKLNLLDFIHDVERMFGFHDRRNPDVY